MRTDFAGQKTIGAMLIAAALIACVPQSDVDRYNLNPSAEATALGYLPLLPVSFFDLGEYTPLDPTNLIGRVARLRAKIRALAGPVIPARDRARLEAAIARR